MKDLLVQAGFTIQDIPKMTNDNRMQANLVKMCPNTYTQKKMLRGEESGNPLKEYASDSPLTFSIHDLSFDFAKDNARPNVARENISSPEIIYFPGLFRKTRAIRTKHGITKAR